MDNIHDNLVENGHWTVDNGQYALDNEPWMINIGH